MRTASHQSFHTLIFAQTISALGLGLVVWLIAGYSALPLPHTSEQSHVRVGKLSLERSSSPALDAANGSVFLASSQMDRKDQGPLSNRFRLAGTFVSSDSAGDRRQAVLDDLSARRQVIVGEAELLEDVKVVSILRESIILEGPNGEEQLWLSFAGKAIHASGSRIEAGIRDPGYGKVSGGDRFGGRQVGERNWVFQRDAVLSYYAELMDSPERLLHVFDSLKPVYDNDRKITGYRLGLEGEADFFSSVGLVEGDVIESVNSVRMTNRRRAESFIKEFVNDRANAFVLDVKRGDKTEKFVYQLR